MCTTDGVLFLKGEARMVPYEKMIKIIGRWTITVELEYLGDDYPIDTSSGSTIKPLMLPDGSEDTLAVEEYEDFVINLLGVFDRCDFEVIEERESPYSHSYYYDLVKKDQFNKKDYKYILYIRVSDHELGPERKQNQRKWFSDHAEAQKTPKSKSKQRWKLKRLTVNKDTYYSYDEALDDIEDRLISM